MTSELKVPYAIDPSGAEVRPAQATRNVSYLCPDLACSRRDLIYRHGPIVRAHFAHRVLPERCEFWRETEAHLRAKRIVAALIEDGATVTLLRRCSECGEEARQPLPVGIVRASLEYPLASGLRADVALLDATGAARAIVEIFSTHEVDSVKEEALGELPWIELDAQEIFAEPSVWRPLQDHFRAARCRRCRFAASRPFLGLHRLEVACPLPNAGRVVAVAACPQCSYFLGVKDGAVFCYGNTLEG